MNIHDKEYKIRSSITMMFFFVVGMGSWSILCLVGTLNNIQLERYWLALVCAIFSLAIFLVVIRGLRKEVGSMLFSESGILVRRPFERFGLIKRKPTKEFIAITDIQRLRIKLGYRAFTRFYIEKLNGGTIEMGFVPLDPLAVPELQEFLKRRKIPIELVIAGPDRK